MSDVEERGFAVIAGAVMIALALFMGFGAAVVVAQSNLIHSAKIAQELIATRAHEDLRVIHNPGETEIKIRNIGSTPSVVNAILLKGPDNSLSVYIPDKVFYVGILENCISHLQSAPAEDSTVGVLTSFGNVFWET